MSANERQVGGNHYRPEGSGLQHWDLALQWSPLYCVIQITRYASRWRRKNGRQDLEKIAHYLEKHMEYRQAQNEQLAQWMESLQLTVSEQELILAAVDGRMAKAHEWLGHLLEECSRLERNVELAKRAAAHNAESDTGHAVDTVDTGEPQAHGYVSQDGPAARADGYGSNGALPPSREETVVRREPPKRAPTLFTDPRPPQQHECVKGDVWIETLGGGTEQWRWEWNGKHWVSRTEPRRTS